MVAAFLKLGIPTMMSASAKARDLVADGRRQGGLGHEPTVPSWWGGAMPGLLAGGRRRTRVRSSAVCTFAADGRRGCSMHIGCISGRCDGSEPAPSESGPARRLCSRGAYRTRQALPERRTRIHGPRTRIGPRGRRRAAPARLSTRDRHRRPVVADRTRPVSAVRAAEAQVAEARPPATTRSRSRSAAGRTPRGGSGPTPR